VSKWRREPYAEVKKGLQMLGRVDSSKPAAKNVTAVYLLWTKKMKRNLDKQVIIDE